MTNGFASKAATRTRSYFPTGKSAPQECVSGMNPSLLTFLVSLGTAILAAPAVALICQLLGVVDRPDGYRKLHASAVPLTGGPTITISVVLAMLAAVFFFPGALLDTKGDFRFLVALSCASALIVLVGILDDRIGLRGRQKLLGQFMAAVIMLPSGIQIRSVEILGYPIEFGDLSIVVTLFWILGAINSLNLIDGVDGLASTTGIVLSLSIAAVTYITGGRPDGLLISLALAGALCGFLVYNFPPARMFLGDSGSMLIGLILGCVALKCSVKQYTAVALIMPTAIWAIPIFDSAMAIIRRRLTGRSIYATDRGHLHHCLVRRGHTGGRLLLVVASLCALTGAGAIASATFGNDLIAITAVLTAIALLVVTRSFGHAELTLLTNRVRRFATSLLRRLEGPKPLLHHEQVRLQGKHEWDEVWAILTEFAEQHDLDCVELMVNLPSIGEEYHATWRTKSNVEQHEAWRTEIPLIVGTAKAGHIKLIGGAEGSFSTWLSRVAEGLKPFENEFASIVADLRQKHSIVPAPVLKTSVLVEQVSPQA